MLTLERQRSANPILVSLRALLVLSVWLPLPCALAGAILFGAFQDALPPTPNILEPPPGSATRIYTLDGRPIGGLERGLSPWARYDEIPPLVVQAFLAAEDDEFFLHDGMDLTAIARAALANLRASGVTQGGSTITQQLAKMFVGQARTYERKFVELLVARRIEGAFSKTEILEAYLNRIYLGAGAYGVRAAARLYFDHTLEGVTLDEAATLAGIASAPSAFEPYDYPDRARERRDLVLARMRALGFASEADVAAARERPVVLRERGEIPEPPLPYLVDDVRTDLVAEHGAGAWRYGALTVTTALSLPLQRMAEAALAEGVGTIDRRQGYRGPLRQDTRLDAARFDDLVRDRFPAADRQPRRPALVVARRPDAIEVRLDGTEVSLGPDAWRWAFPFDESDNENGLERADTEGLAEPGDIVLVDVSGDAPRLTQTPRLDAALVSMDLETGYLRAMGAGVDYDRSQFNRVLHGCRQPGSTFKPVVFSRALDMGMTLATPLIDVPLRLPQGGREIWRPRNADGQFQGDMLLRDALIRSRNLPTIDVFRRVGAAGVVDRARRLGFTTPMEPTDALSLGASCVYPVDVATAYGVFANRGYRQRPVRVVSVVDGRGALVADHGAWFDPAGSASATLYRALRDAAAEDHPVIDPRTAYLITYALHDVVEMGTGFGAQALGVPAAGKTGTTNAFDAWFAGFTERYVTAVWVGTDRNTRALGRGEHGAEVALPIWLDYMHGAVAGLAQGSLTEPRPAGISYIRVDRETGLLAHEDAPGFWLPFREGTEPTEYALTPEERDLRRLDALDYEF